MSPHELPSAVMIVLNYNAKDLLARFLPSILSSARASKAVCRVMVLDNQSTDGSAEFVKSQFPEVEVFRSTANKVLCSFNEAAQAVNEDVLILLNNDIQTETDFVDPLLQIFQKESPVFCVTTEGDRSIPKLRWGTLTADVSYPQYEKLRQSPGFAFSAGIGAFDRKKFLELGGYDELYLPGYYEDVDLGFRAWKKGWKTFYQPESRKAHLGSASFKKTYGSTYIQQLTYRNSILFMIKNITDPFLIVQWAFFQCLRLATAWMMGKWFFYRGFWSALGKIPQAWKARRTTLRSGKEKDRHLIYQLSRKIQSLVK